MASKSIGSRCAKSTEGVSEGMRVSAFRRKWRVGTRVTAAVALLTVSVPVMADAFGSVHYDAKGDQLLVTLLYDGTNPDHHFSIQWGRCRKVIDQLHEPAHQVIELSILDGEGNDAAIRSYTKIVRVPLAGLSCRPATVTLWTPPNSHTSLAIP